MKTYKLIIIAVACLALSACANHHHGAKPYFQRQHANQAKLIKDVRADGVQVFNIGNSLRLVLSSDYFFEQDTTHLNRPYEQALVNIADLLKRYPNRQITVSAHTDDVGTLLARRHASKDQAEQIAAFLWAQGIERSRLHIVGSASKENVSSDQTIFGSSANRRVEINIS